jgi:hypothetical protein
VPVDPHRLDDLLFGEDPARRRFTQDSPILPDVWAAYNEAPGQRLDLLLTPHAPRPAAHLAHALRRRVADEGAARIAYTNTYVVAALTFDELVGAALPLSAWWRDHVASERDPARRDWLGELTQAVGDVAPSVADDGADEVAAAKPADDDAPEELAPGPLLFLVTLNRAAATTLRDSVKAVKADAAKRLFLPVCKTLRWAVIDGGVDATHPAFERRDANGEGPPGGPWSPTATGEPGTRVWRRYDFTRLRGVLAGDGLDLTKDTAQQLHRRLRRGQAVDWDLVADQVLVPPGEQHEALEEHGTHVAGILAGDWPDAPDGPLVGMCPDMEILDLRVISPTVADEFSILGALQFVRHLNARAERRVIHGVNLSFSLRHHVRNFACGRTPICEEVERLVGSGVVVVAAAGNDGWYPRRASDTSTGVYRQMSITDPGNAYGAITVGATHRSQPHVYGVSFFSSRGPTGDGRRKPDLVAPGEKITAPIPGHDAATRDGTSMAAPHVSGAAALLMARHEELVGDPAAIKRILCDTATDLGREPYHQGAGMLDVLRALQAH